MVNFTTPPRVIIGSVIIIILLAILLVVPYKLAISNKYLIFVVYLLVLIGSGIGIYKYYERQRNLQI